MIDTRSDRRHARQPLAVDPARLLDAVAHPFALADRQGRVVALNSAAQATLGWHRGARLAEHLTHAQRDPGTRDGDLALLLTGDGPLLGRTIEAAARRADGRVIPVQLTVTALEDDDDRRLAVSLSDMTQREDARDARRDAEARAADAFAASTVGVAIVGVDGRFLEVNPALCALLDRDEATLRACSFQELTHPDDLESDLSQLRRTLAGELDSYQLPKRYLRPDGGIVWALLTVTIVRGGDGRPRHFVSQIQDITDRKTSEDELRRYTAQLAALADTDPLTGLANRRVLEAAIERELHAGGDAPCRVAGARLDGGGHALLTAVERVADAVDGCGLLAHLGGGELAILLDTTDPDALVARIDAALAAPGTATTAVARPGDTPATLLARLHATDDREAPAPAAAQDLPSGVTRLLELARRQLAMPVSLRTPDEDDGAVLAGAGVPVRLRSGKVYGMLCVGDTRAHPELGTGGDQLLRFVAELAAELIDQREEDRAIREVELSTTGVRALLAALEARDFYTSEHSREVVALAIAVARRLGVAEHAVRDIEQVALLHDIGKLGIPDAILQKQGPLDDLQWEIMRQHPVIGERIIAGTAGLTHLAPAMRAEHERYDGGGYPDGLAAGAIPLASRITLACDALHAMTSDRPYRPAMTADRARQELRDGAGTQFDPAVVGALLAELSGSR